MAITNNLQGVYNGGAVRFDSSPQTNFLMQMLAKKQAQQQALDQYYRQVQERTTPDAVRQQDMDGFQNRVGDWQNSYLQNKRAILSGNLTANQDFNQRHMDLLAYANKSKQAAKDELLISQHKFSGNYHPTSTDIDVMHRISAPIDSPEHYKDEGMTTPYTADDLSFNVKDLDEKKYTQSLIAGQKMSTNPVGKPQDIGNYKLRQGYETGYTPQQVTNFGSQVLMDAKTNPSVKKLAENRYDDIDLYPQLKDQLNTTYKQYFGQDAQTPEDYYAAEMMGHLSQKSTSSKDTTNTKQLEDFLERGKNYRASTFGTYGQQQQTNQNVDDLIQGYKDNRDDKGRFFPSADVFKVLTGLPQTPRSFIKVDDNGNFVSGKYGLDDNGNVTDQETEVKQIPAAQGKAALTKFFKSGLQGNYNNGNKEPTYNYKGKTVTQTQLENAAKASGMTVDEYKKNIGLK